MNEWCSQSVLYVIIIAWYATYQTIVIAVIVIVIFITVYKHYH